MLILRLGVFSIACGDKVLENAGLGAQEQERADSGKTSSKECRHTYSAGTIGNELNR